MVGMSLSEVQRLKQDLSYEELQICLIALHVFHNLIKNADLQVPIVESILLAEKYYRFSLDENDRLTHLDKYSDEFIGNTYDKLCQMHEDLNLPASND